MHIICKKKKFVIDPFNYHMPTNSNKYRFVIQHMINVICTQCWYVYIAYSILLSSSVRISEVNVGSELHNRIHPNV